MRSGFDHFNIRVYGLLFYDDRVLTVHEQLNEYAFTKFPGGGLEYGEGLEECLMREFQEEMQIEIQLDEMIYVNEFFQASAFRKQDQLIAMYYRVYTKAWDTVERLVAQPPLEVKADHLLDFQWQPIDDKLSQTMTFPVDQKVAELISQSS